MKPKHRWLPVTLLLLLACQEESNWTGDDADTARDADVEHDDADNQISDADQESDVEWPDADAGDADIEADGDGTSPLPPCEVVDNDISISFDPPEPWSGSSPRVRVHGDLGLTNVALAVDPDDSAPAPEWIDVEGDGPWTWIWSLPLVEAGDYCVVFAADPEGQVYQRARLHVDRDPPAVAPFEVIENHQWTCEEMYTWAINVDVRVIDETGAPMPGVRVLVEHDPCDIAEDHPPPTEVVTDGEGFARWENYNPDCFFHLSVADAPSDRAIEIWTGIWEEQEGCNFCNTFAVNVYGHWSYSVTFQRTPGATEVCQVQNDQAGQSRCPPLPHWEDPVDPACTPL